MRTTYTAVVLLAATPSIYAISLSDFQPYLTDLPTSCENVYIQQVSGCTATDFKSGKGCSTSCISGLQALVPMIQLGCSSANVLGSNNVVNTFLSSDGVKSLCPNAPAATLSTTSSSIASTTSSTTATTPSTTSTQAASTTAAATTTAEQTTTTSSSSTSSTAAMSSDAPVVATTSSSLSTSMTSTTSSSAAAVMTFSSSTSSSAMTATSSAAFVFSSVGSSTSTTSPASATASQNSNNISGGGSPFDVTSKAAGRTTGFINAVALFLSGLLAAYIL